MTGVVLDELEEVDVADELDVEDAVVGVQAAVPVGQELVSSAGGVQGMICR